MTNKDILLALAIIFIWGFNFVVIAWGIEGIPPLLLGGLRFLLVALVGSLFFKRPKTPIKWWFAYALPISFLQFAFLFSAMDNGMPAGLASLALQSQALFTLVFAMLFLKESIKGFQVLAIFIAALGLIFIAQSHDSQTMTVLGFALTLAGAASWAMGNIANKTISQKGYAANVNLIIWSAWIPPIPFFIASYFIEGPDLIIDSLSNFGLQSAIALIYLSVLATVVGYGLWSYLLKKYPAAQVAPLTLGVPVVGLSSAALILNESISQAQWIGISLVVVGLLVNTFGAKLLASLLKTKPVT
ncbi:acetylserine transporter [Marinomonas sp. SBI22]|uniref:EamA family transporter n=1 Tax=unclassified Marinomonas TaxID=196814 RepID=UPI0007AF73CD|nr:MULTISPECIES: EamA family transporter [unclassified Marinomonas]KZM41049.1 acetylserine transporter [Marinomonas sp. SBI22]KZM42889.1 acetylserine transporter [Marinomonas sp. SBI8L]